MTREQTYKLVASVFGLVLVLIMFFNLEAYYEFNRNWFWLFLILPVLAAIYVLRKYLLPRINTSSSFGFQGISESPLVPLKNILFVLLLAGIGLLIFCIARPHSKTEYENITKEGIDMIISMDISMSMMARDFKPNRLAKAKEVAQEFIMDRPNDRFGIVLYEGESYTSVPLTTDQKVVVESLTEVESGLIEGGTAIGMGLATAVNRLKDSESKSKVIILLSDGVNNRGSIDPKDAAILAKSFGIRVYTIGIGKKGRAQFPLFDQYGNIVQYQWAEVEIDEELLGYVAETTGGKYFRAKDGKSLKEIYAEIDKLEKTKFNVARYSKKTEEYYRFGVGAFLVLLSIFFLSNTVFKSTP